jgi:N-acetylglucosamine-6-phosphate deacetylase
MDTTGWIDLQVNGFLGVDFSAPGLTRADVAKVVEALRARGTSACCPTLVTCDPDVYARNLPMLAEAMRDAETGPHIGGIHLEGPFLSMASRGAHPARWLAAPDAKRFDAWQRLANGGIRILTVAPEVEGAETLIRHAVAQGVAVSLGHHLASDDAIRRAVDAGATLCTHLGNGIVNTLPRHPNPIWTQLAEDGLTACVIADGHHVPASFLRVAWRAKGADRFIVTSDAAAIAGLPAGPYRYMGSDVEIEPSGRIALTQSSSDGGATLAGSSSTMADCMGHLASLGDWTQEDLVRVGRINPARVLGSAA